MKRTQESNPDPLAYLNQRPIYILLGQLLIGRWIQQALRAPARHLEPKWQAQDGYYGVAGRVVVVFVGKMHSYITTEPFRRVHGGFRVLAPGRCSRLGSP